MRRNERGLFRTRTGLAVVKLALIMLVVLTVAPMALGASRNDKDVEFRQVYRHTFDEVFQASQEAIERLGWFVTGIDKDKGIISCSFMNSKVTFDLQMETVSQKPETQVTIVFIKTGRVTKDSIWHTVSTELQKVLSTYR